MKLRTLFLSIALMISPAFALASPTGSGSERLENALKYRTDLERKLVAVESQLQELMEERGRISEARRLLPEDASGSGPSSGKIREILDREIRYIDSKILKATHERNIVALDFDWLCGQITDLRHGPDLPAVDRLEDLRAAPEQRLDKRISDLKIPEGWVSKPDTATDAAASAPAQ